MYEAIVISMEMPKKFKDGIQGQYTTTVGYESRPYWNTTTGAVDYSYSMSVPSLIGYNGPKFCIYRPNPIIKIQILNDSGQELTDYNNNVITYVKLLLKFKPIY